MKPRFLWVTDPWSTLDHPKDTTLRLMEECISLKIENHWCEAKSIRWEKGKVRVDSARVRHVGSARSAADIRLDPPKARTPGEFTHLFYRNDPPVNAEYLYPLQLLDLGMRGHRGKIFSPPRVIFGSNEKTEFFGLKGLVPDALVSADVDRLLAYLTREKRAVLKPLNSAQSIGVRVLQATEGEVKNRKVLQATTAEGMIPVLLQEYLPGIAKGEVRLWFSAGKLVAKARKMPASGESVIDMDRGGQVVATDLTDRESRAVIQIGKHLRTQKILWAAVDLIDGKITDFNFTSPGLLVQLERITGKNLAAVLLKDALKSV